MELGLNQRASLEQAKLFPRKIQESEKRKEPVRSSPDCLFPIYHGSVLVRGGTLSSPISNVKRTGTPPGVRKEVNPRYTWEAPRTGWAQGTPTGITVTADANHFDCWAKSERVVFPGHQFDSWRDRHGCDAWLRGYSDSGCSV